MQQSFVALLALASSALAMPSKIHARNITAILGTDSTDSTESVDSTQDNIDWVHGTCGGNTGFVCQSGYCCSKFGFCGNTPEYCNGGTAPPTNGGGNSGGGLGSGGSVTCSGRRSFQGDGSAGAGWPQPNSWATFDNLWNANVATIGISCSQFSQANNSPDETNQLRSAILSVSQQSGVDARFILATVMQESKGCVRVWATTGSVRNPGLMQDHNGVHDCFNKNPCPNSEIVGMIQEGTQGTSSGEGLQQILNRLSSSGAQKIYQAARIYNSGSLPGDGNLSGNGATNSYVSDIANRLTGCVF
jgi:hypothetical protein